MALTFRNSAVPRPAASSASKVTMHAAFPTRSLPTGTMKNASLAGLSHFGRSMAAQAARIPRLANIQRASQALANSKANGGRKR